MLSETIAFIPGRYPTHPVPLGRYLPPLADGVVKEWLGRHLSRGAWIIDPFGASPRQTLEAARAGYRVLVAANNPISRLLIELYANPPDSEMLRAALADLAADPRSGERLEEQIRALYETECEQCSRTIAAQAFIWEREGGVLVGRIYSCPFCKDSGEHPATAADVERAHQYSASGLHRARALERIAPLHDPDRIYAEEALEVYPPRAVNALLRLVNRLERMAGHRRWLASILVLSAFDQANGLWHHPASRYRPRQLTLPARYLEKNIWLSLEAAVTSWAAALEEVPEGGTAITCTIWPELPPSPGSVCIFKGRLKDLALQLSSGTAAKFDFEGMVGALPRPNQAFWTLSALWAGWLWGRAASADFKSVLRRRRYDWGWHLDALHSALSNLTPHLSAGGPCLGLIGEAEPGFVSSALIAGELAGLDLTGVALRSGQEQAQIHWNQPINKILHLIRETSAFTTVGQGMVEYLRQRGEPSSYLRIHSAATEAFVNSHPKISPTMRSPQEALHLMEEAIERSLTQGQSFLQFGTTSRSIEAGQWWLGEEINKKSEVMVPLADRVEINVIQFLRANPACTLDEVDHEVCSQLRGLFTPDLEIVQACLHSYAEEDSPGSKIWGLRHQDELAVRRADLSQIAAIIENLGMRLGYEVVPSGFDSEFSRISPIIWRSPEGISAYEYYLSASGVMGRIIFDQHSSDDGQTNQPRRVIVLPGGRAGLVELKIRRDPRLRREIESGWLFIKFRHIRWLAENKSLNQSNYADSLTLDPLANRDPQMALL